MQQLSGMDAEFLYLETSKAPMHIGSVYICTPPQDGPMSFENFKSYLASRLHVSRTFRQRIVESPLNLGHPYWVEDPHFDLNNHVFHTALPKPGGRKELKALAAMAFARTLDRTKPLWNITFVEGLDGMEDVPAGSFALIFKVHHAAIDGGSGVEMMSALLDVNPNPPKSKPSKAWVPERIPNNVELLAKNYFQVFGTPFRLARFVYDTAQRTVGVAKQVIDNSIQAPPFPFTAPKTLFNTTVSAGRVFGGVELSLEKIKAIKNQEEDLTVNDVVLAICAGAFHKYLSFRKKLPQKPMIAMAPISVRSRNQKGQMGNQVSAMLVSLATNEPDPVKRLRLIHESARASKVYSQAMEATRLMEFIPSTLASLASRLYTSMKLAERHSPFYNLVITNVPGPPMPIYLNGAKLVSHYGTAPILDGLGLLLVVFSYAGKVTISATSTPEIIPDLDRFMAYMHESIEELYLKMVPVEETPKSAKPKTPPQAQTTKKKSTRKSTSKKTSKTAESKAKIAEQKETKTEQDQKDQKPDSLSSADQPKSSSASS